MVAGSALVLGGTDGRPGASSGHMIDRGSGVEPQKLERPAGIGAWRISALVVAVLLVAIVAVGRLGMDPPRSAPGPSPSALAAVTPTPTAVPSPPITPAASPSPALPQLPVGLPLATRYADGIPLSVDGERVLRLPIALALDAGSTLLVGGWYLGPDCGGLGHGGSCPRGRFADTPAGFSRRGGSVDLARLVEIGAGPRVLRVRTSDSACVGAACPPLLLVDEVVWAGDPLTEAGPIDVVPLMSALSFAFPDMAPTPYRDLAQCPMPWPPQTYLSTAGGPRLTLIFPSTQDREDAQAGIRAGRSLLLAELGGDCIQQSGRFRASGRWISEANVMLLLHQGEATLELATAALEDALNQSSADGPAAARPVTTWQALRRLWRVEPTLDLGPRLAESACGATLPTETFLVAHPDVRLLAAFSSRAERRRFQRRVTAGALTTYSTDCSRVGAAPGDVNYRWVGFQNLLLELRGPEWLDEALAEALRGTGIP